MSYCSVQYNSKYNRNNIRLFTLLPPEMMQEWINSTVLHSEKDIHGDVYFCEETRYGQVLFFNIDVIAADTISAYERIFGSEAAPTLHYHSTTGGKDNYTASLLGEEEPHSQEKTLLKAALDQEKQKRQTKTEMNDYVKHMRKNPNFVLDSEEAKFLEWRYTSNGGKFLLYPTDRDPMFLKPFPKHCLNNAFRILSNDFLSGELSKNQDVTSIGLSQLAGRDGSSVRIIINNKTTNYYSDSFTGSIWDDAEPRRILERCVRLGIIDHVHYAMYKLKTVSALDNAWVRRFRHSEEFATQTGAQKTNHAALYNYFLP